MAIPRMYRPGEAAQVMGISRRQVIRYMDQGKLGHVQIANRNKRGLRLIPEPEILKFLNQHARGCKIEPILDQTTQNTPQRFTMAPR